MTNRTGVVYDLGYKPHEGPRLGRKGAFRATAKDGIRRVLGFRRRFRRKIMPWMLVGIAVTPGIVIVGLSFLLQNFNPTEVDLFSHSMYFDLTAIPALLFCALAAPELIIPDREEGVLNVYASRPLRSWDYLLARLVALAFVVLGFLLLPQLLLYVGLAAVSADGFGSALWSNLDQWPKILLAALGYFAGYAAPAFLISTFIKKPAAASGIYLAVMIGAVGVAAGLAESGAIPGSRYAALGAIEHHPRVVRDWVFGLSNSDWVPTNADFAQPVSLLVIVGIAAVTVWVTGRRYGREL